MRYEVEKLSTENMGYKKIEEKNGLTLIDQRRLRQVMGIT
jgi:hypothetical protein